MLAFARTAGHRSLAVALIGLVSFLSACEGTRPTENAAHHTPSLSGTAPSFAVNPGETVHFYVHAHQDDWEVFMGDRASSSMQTANSVVFIYTTAGDGGQSASYWQTRELAAQAAMDVLAGSGSWTCAAQTVLGHAIRRCAKGKVVAYDMRLPDGAASGEGFAGRGSLSFLRDGQITTFAALDGSTTYASWQDLYTTIRGIIDLESGNQSAPYVEVHAPEYDRTLNPGDHPDHTATGDAVHAAAGARSWNISWYIGNQTQNMAVNLTQAAHDLKQNIFYAYDNYMGAAGLGRNQYDSDFQAWLWRTYYRTDVSVPPPPPTAPTNLQAQPTSSISVTLRWTDNSSNESGFYVERAPDNGGTPGAFSQIASPDLNATTYTDAGLTPNTIYWYRVRAYNAGGASAYSNQGSATTLQPVAAPSSLTATARSSTRIDLVWVDNASNEAGYYVERAPDNAGAPGTFTQIASLTANTAAYSDATLSPNTRYWYRVRAFNSTDVSAYSGQVSAVSLQGLPVPTNLQAQVVSATQINLSWTDNASSETGYVVERALDNGGAPGAFAQIASLGANATTYSDLTTSQNTRYWYRVRAFNANDVSAYSTPVSATTPLLPPAAPSNLQATALSSSRVDLAWTDNATNETGFYVERAPDNNGVPGTFTQIGILGSNATAYSDLGLAPTTTYWYRVRSYNASGNSAYTSTAHAMTLSPPTSRTDFYFHGHEDDWQLFMGEHAYNSVQIATKVVFVYSTAGDAGRPSAFWQAREQGAQLSVDAYVGAGSWTCGNQVIQGHAIHRCTKGKAVSYDLRLPDGGTNGEGFLGHGSMAMLRDGQIASITAIDGSTSYSSWTDLTSTIRGIIDQESGNQSAPYVEVNAPEYDRTVNINDHPDHLATGDLVHAAALTRNWNLTWYIDYQVQYLPVNLSQAMYDIKATAFNAYDDYMGHMGYGENEYEPEYQAWLWRSYTRSAQQ
ncbi:MAG TPA: fibronectin type III domain-containing protein [Gemmatimonadaceae bacterium]|nr:fibronectin type III domain-containing protein [Gemmatimonadaceae bacterium]